MGLKERERNQRRGMATSMPNIGQHEHDAQGDDGQRYPAGDDFLAKELNTAGEQHQA